jgi:hypothetical protein
MVIIQALLTLIVHSFGRVVNMVFSWATVMLFGRVPQERQIFLSIVAFGSIVWLIVILGIAFPSVAAFLLAFVSLPKWVDDAWIRIGMMAMAVIIPPLVGEAAIRAVDPDKQPARAARIADALLFGYRLSFGIAVALVALVVIAPALWGRNLRRRWTTRHVPIVVHRHDYLDVLNDVQHALNAGGVFAERGQIWGLLRIPTSVLAFAAEGRIRGLDTETARLSSGRIEILLYPFDLVISGDPPQVFRAQALAAERLPYTRAYMTWSQQGNVLEDRLRRVWMSADGDKHSARAAAAAMTEVEGIRHDLKSACLAYEEWEVLFREVLMAERDLLGRLTRYEQAREVVRES